MCENHVDRVITVYYCGPTTTEIDWWVCTQHAYELVIPVQLNADATLMVDGWTGVAIASADRHERYVVVPEIQVPDCTEDRRD